MEWEKGKKSVSGRYGNDNSPPRAFFYLSKIKVRWTPTSVALGECTFGREIPPWNLFLFLDWRLLVSSRMLHTITTTWYTTSLIISIRPSFTDEPAQLITAVIVYSAKSLALMWAD